MPSFVTPFSVLGKQIEYVGIINFMLMYASAISLTYYALNKSGFLKKIKCNSKVQRGNIVLLLILAFLLIFKQLQGYSLSFGYTFFLEIAIFIAIVVYSKFGNKERLVLSDSSIRNATLILLLLITPFYVGATSHSIAIVEVQSMKSDQSVVDFAAGYTYNHTYSIYQTYPIIGLFRSGNDLPSFCLLGYSGCQELAYIEKSILDEAGIQSRYVILPGEDHEFLEVYINGTWMVSDPGYTGQWLNTTTERGQARLTEPNIGGVSFVYTFESNGTLVWRTADYVPVDTITLTITNNSVPISGGQVTLNHEFQGHQANVNGFTLNDNGTVTFQMGSLQGYSDPNTEKSYWVSVDGIPTGFNITSFGLNQTRCYNIDIGLKTSSLLVLNN